jgi:hypothetical protein
VSRVRFFRPQTSLSILVSRPGGRSREEAVAEAARRVELQRIPAMDMIDGLIAKLGEKIVSLRHTSLYELPDILHNADQIISLAATFELGSLTHAARNLCDLCRLFSKEGRIDIDAVTIHVYAIHLLGPKSSCSGETANAVLDELDGLLEHFCRRTAHDCTG